MEAKQGPAGPIRHLHSPEFYPNPFHPVDLVLVKLC